MNTVWIWLDGTVKGYFVMGENPVVGSMNGALQREGTAATGLAGGARFFSDRNRRVLARRAGDRARRSSAGGHRHRSVLFSRGGPHRKKTAASRIHSGCCSGITKAIEPPGDCRSELDFIFKLGQRLKQLYATNTTNPGIGHSGSDLGLPDRGTA